MNKSLKHIILVIVAIIAVNFISTKVYKRFDLTTDQRYTLNEATLDIIKKAETPIVIDVFLEGEDFPSEFRRLQSETKQLLEEFRAYNDNISFKFINPTEDEDTRDQAIKQLNARGLTPMQLNVQENGKQSQEVIFPWALASYDEVTVKIPLVKNKIGETQQQLVTNSVQHLEYAFADGISKLVNPKRRKIAVLKGNNEMDNLNIADYVKTLRDYYFIAPFTLDSVSNNPEKTLKSLKDFDLIIAAKPTEAFTEKEKFILDQYTMNGGKSLWLIDQVAMDKDSLYNDFGKNVALARDLNLTDFFFKYGVRINPVLVSSMYSAPIVLLSGEGSNTRAERFPWTYSPLAQGISTHPVVNNLNYVKFDFASPIDTLKNNLKTVKKTVLLQSAPLSKLEGTPREISLDEVNNQQDPASFNKGSQNLAVLLEGKFTSVYNNRVKPFDLKDVKNESVPTKMIVISDGDVIKNEIDRNGPKELGYDSKLNQFFGNKEFLVNAANYLLDDNGLINIRSKEIAVAFLNSEKITEEKTKWQLLNILLPLVLLGIFGFSFNYFRKKKYAK
ncbi:ABC-2 type transport system permease protein [Mesoflavibacter sabulilitoris]|uniref:Gliding motility-associated ABC transporter substrate-binding protein GldG n=1 Tax=Mesoflavibacter zeaxanthinifaciens subsp. sabulilitoris TaxID=1520893 RepID=A0A2T1NFH6_9FLAO|nr:gliding motility-associated ABC transporter substrate-binding protein GldG [Mesoflavibacter zeaxanthinifaciens]MBB3124873.1 ABC-2 type transport system permease protein [Mesoflavibacter zeaxanthinifaciens subsp. sabulilitoris]PSG91201.1 gliding motility-associated ABC transporter substrate-binding protein GldG [Mesoflavibacter zeaxanthinifaciens subsp. sabulilitoris]